LQLDAYCTDQCAKDAAEFTRFVNSEDVFLSELLPKERLRHTFCQPKQACIRTELSLRTPILSEAPHHY
jgi:hypothetical protein